MNQILIISPDEQLIQIFHRCLSAVKSPGKAAILRQYPSHGQLATVLQSKSFNTVIVGLSEPDRALELIAELHSGPHEAVVIAAHTSNCSDLILTSIRTGASEYLGPPFEPDHVERALASRNKQVVKTAPKGRLISFVPARAGCGASTVAMHVAAAMSTVPNQRALLVDFDFHEGAVDFCLGLKPEFTIADALERSNSLDELWNQLTCKWKGLDVLARPLDYSQRPENMEKAPSIFRSARRCYDWVVADLPSPVYTSCQDVLVQADAVYIVSTPEIVSMHLARRKVLELRALGIPTEDLRLVVNRVGSKRSFSAEEVAASIGLPVTWILRNDYKAVNAASLGGRLVQEDCELGKQFQELAWNIMSLRQPEARPPRVLSWKGLLTDSHDSRALVAAPRV
ncbi:MAG: hypothetical protein HY238_13605 [Acidobacteria bacterium]|nr:hypothetical protein [Acidobacteriota bacterium]